MSKNALADLLNGKTSAQKMLFLERRENYLLQIEKEFELPLAEWGKIEWKAVASVVISEKIENEFRLDDTTDVVKELFLLNLIKQARDQNREEGKTDTKNRKAFQETVIANQEDYSNLADAVNDLRIKPQFEKYSEDCLRGWAKQVWTKPLKAGRPKKTPVT